MSRYEFTTREGFLVCTVEARTAREAAEQARGRTGLTDLVCSHLGDDHHVGGYVDPMFSYGPLDTM